MTDTTKAIAALHRIRLERPGDYAKLTALLDRLANEHRAAERTKPPQRANIHVGQLAEIEDDMTDYPAETIAEVLDIPLEDVQEAIAYLISVEKQWV